MCYAPIQLPNGDFAGCRECRQCKDKYVDDWVGRCTAEAKTARKTVCMTLTYGPDAQGNTIHDRSEMLKYADFQLFMKRLRKKHDVRFFVVGEYGKEKGRSHWHCMLFFQSEPPRFPKLDSEGRIWLKEWPHGHINLDEMANTLKAVRYACKYLQKDSTQQCKMSRSTKPALGEDYFVAMAKQMVKEGIAPRDLGYTFKEHRCRTGKLKRYYMHRGLARKFVQTWIETWTKDRVGQAMPESALIDDYLDRNAEAALLEMEMEDYLQERKNAQLLYQERLAKEREKRFQSDIAEERENGDRQEQEKAQGATSRDNKRPGSDWNRAAAARRADRRGRGNTSAPGYDKSRAIHTPESLGRQALRKRRP